MKLIVECVEFRAFFSFPKWYGLLNSRNQIRILLMRIILLDPETSIQNANKILFIYRREPISRLPDTYTVFERIHGTGYLDKSFCSEPSLQKPDWIIQSTEFRQNLIDFISFEPGYLSHSSSGFEPIHLNRIKFSGITQPTCKRFHEVLATGYLAQSAGDIQSRIELTYAKNTFDI